MASNDSEGKEPTAPLEEKEKLMSEILELQTTLHDLSQRVHSVKEESEQLKTDNQVTEINTAETMSLLLQ